MTHDHFVDHQLAELCEEKSKSEKLSQISSRLVNSLVLAFAVEHSQTIRYDTTYYYHFFLYLLIVVVAFFIESEIEELLKDDKIGMKSLLLYIRSFASLAIVYFLFLAAKLFSDTVQSEADDEPWSYSRIIIPFIFASIFLAIPLIIDSLFFEPALRKDDVKKIN
jgi:hypothetical protein